MRTDTAVPRGTLPAWRPAEELGARWDELTGLWAERPGGSLGTLGPAGTSSHLAADFLAERYGLRVELMPTFDEVLSGLLAKSFDFALVPSAYQGLTRFHWHRDLRLRAFFPQATPEYGIAERPDAGPPGGTGPVAVAAMWEVRWIYSEVVPAALRGREVRWVDAASTQHAAELLRDGEADLALTNAPGVRGHGLRWVSTRPGAEIIWTLFGHAGDAFEPRT
ncbi:hypothetical protein AB0I16_33470 [Streptomyces sp. NPDC050703]|uniref:hypothetical protein n=1 Tax=Streptomyces sp. NPDC050703 TaxID=3157218 RepID=UPI00342559ED